MFYNSKRRWHVECFTILEEGGRRRRRKRK